MAQERVSSLQPNEQVAVFSVLVRQQYALDYMEGVLSMFRDEPYKQYLKHETKKLWTRLQRYIDGYKQELRANCIGGDADYENLMDAAYEFSRMMKKPIFYMEHLNARLILKAGYGHQDILTKLSVCHVIMDTTAYLTGVHVAVLPQLKYLGKIGGQPSIYGSCEEEFEGRKPAPNQFCTFHREFCKLSGTIFKRLGLPITLRYEVDPETEEGKNFNRIQELLKNTFCDTEAICALSHGVTAEEAVKMAADLREQCRKEQEKEKHKEELKQAKKAAKVASATTNIQ